MYELTLVPELDVGKHVVVLELVLHRPGRRNKDSNLFDPTGRLFGYQRWDFAASDFVRGAQDSIYGDTRVINLPKLGMEMHVKVAAVSVEPTPPNSPESLPYQFKELTLQVTAQKLAKGDSKKVAP